MHIYGHMHYAVQMKQETHVQQKPMTCHLSIVSANHQQSHPIDINITLDAQFMY